MILCLFVCLFVCFCFFICLLILFIYFLVCHLMYVCRRQEILQLLPTLFSVIDVQNMASESVICSTERQEFGNNFVRKKNPTYALFQGIYVML